jgi:hypothetical protein
MCTEFGTYDSHRASRPSLPVWSFVRRYDSATCSQPMGSPGCTAAASSKAFRASVFLPCVYVCVYDHVSYACKYVWSAHYTCVCLYAWCIYVGNACMRISVYHACIKHAYACMYVHIRVYVFIGVCAHLYAYTFASRGTRNLYPTCET